MRLRSTVILAALVGVLSSAAVYGNAPLLAAAEEAFEKKDYAAALPLLQQLAADNKDNRAAWLQIKKRINICADRLGKEQFEKFSWRPGMPRAEIRRKEHVPPKPGEALSMGIKQLGNFDYDAEKGGTIPADVKALSGHTIKLWGYMVPIREAKLVTEFALIPSPESCCFGQPPGVHHTVTVRLAAGSSAKVTVEPVVATGTLKVEEKREDGLTSSIFELQRARVEPAPPNKDSVRGIIPLGPAKDQIR